MAQYLWIVTACLAILFCANPSCAYSGKLLLVSMDGFRWDYLYKLWDKLPNFRRFAAEGVRAPYIENIFLTETFPSHYSIATGEFY